MIKNNDEFPIFDPVTEQHIGYKPRAVVHTKGHWHKGVQANIIRPNESGTFDILVQLRSTDVDIGDEKYDQSLATQMIREDDLDEKITLQRGLKNELGITSYKAVLVPIKCHIIKTYIEHPGTNNRELIRLYMVECSSDQEPISCTNKIKSIQWMEWGSFLQFFNGRQNDFTKTAQFYFSNKAVLSIIEIMGKAMVQNEEISSDEQMYRFLHIDKWPVATYTLQGEHIEETLKGGYL